MGKEGEQPTSRDVEEAREHAMQNLPNEHEEQEIALDLLQEALKGVKIVAPLVVPKPEKQKIKQKKEDKDWSPF